MSDCRFGVSPVNYPDPDPDLQGNLSGHVYIFHVVMTCYTSTCQHPCKHYHIRGGGGGP